MHHDGNSHTGWILKMRKSYLGYKSGKQRVGSPSSTDAEIIDFRRPKDLEMGG